MDLERCRQCGELVAHIRYPWDDGGGQEIYCLVCKPITEEEKEMLEYAEYRAKKRKLRLSTKSCPEKVDYVMSEQK